LVEVAFGHGQASSAEEYAVAEGIVLGDVPDAPAEGMSRASTAVSADLADMLVVLEVTVDGGVEGGVADVAAAAVAGGADAADDAAAGEVGEDGVVDR
jgi:hypothetical protein